MSSKAKFHYYKYSGETTGRLVKGELFEGPFKKDGTF